MSIFKWDLQMGSSNAPFMTCAGVRLWPDWRGSSAFSGMGKGASAAPRCCSGTHYLWAWLRLMQPEHILLRATRFLFHDSPQPSLDMFCNACKLLDKNVSLGSYAIPDGETYGNMLDS